MHDPKPDNGNKVVLLVDDDEDDLEIFAEALAVADQEVTLRFQTDGEKLIPFLEQESTTPDVIFLDLNMPRKNGRECLREITRHDRFSHIPIIIYSTSLNPRDIEETFHEGASYFFRKPPTLSELESILSGVISSGKFRRRAQDLDAFILEPPIR